MIHFPIIYISLAAAVLFNQIKRFYFRSRKFFLLTMARLLFSGLKRVEFKDFWVADMLCSQTYALGNIALFFCLYMNSWNEPANCNSSHSRLMGFFFRLCQLHGVFFNAFVAIVTLGRYSRSWRIVVNMLALFSTM